MASTVIERATGLWTVDAPLRVGGLPMGTRTTLIRCASGGLFMHSPGPLSGDVREGIEALGDVETIVAPNCFHHFFVEENVRTWPNAKVYLAPGLRERKPKLPAAEDLSSDAVPAAFARDLEMHIVAGAPRMGEVVFFHGQSRTLLLTDLAFNVRSAEGAIARLGLKLFGVYGRFGSSRLEKRVLFRDRKAVRASLDHILAWDFDRIVVTHGEIVESGGRGLFLEAFQDI